ncbi:MAG: ribonuclease P protein component [Dehalococcoidia bacterium]
MVRAGRLRKGAEFDAVFKKGSAVAGPLFVLRYGPPSGEVARWGFAVGKKLAKRSVTRNAVRRKMRAAARAIDGVAPCDLVVIGRAGSLTAGVAGFESALRRSLAKAGLTAEGGGAP